MPSTCNNPAEVCGKRRSALPLTVLLLPPAIVAFCLVWLATRWGIGLTADSALYLASARNFAAGDGIVQAVYGTKIYSQKFAPLFPCVLAFGEMLTGTDPQVAARWLQAILFALNVVLAGLLTRRVAGHTGLPVAVAGWLTVLPVTMIHLHSLALTEPLFLFTELLALLWLGRYLEEERWVWLAMAAIAIGLNLLTRYSGVALLVAALLYVVLRRRCIFGRRIRDGLTVVALGALPMLGWIARNARFSGKALGHNPEVENQLYPAIRRMVLTVIEWILPYPVHLRLKEIVFLGLLFLLVGWLFSAYRRGARLCPEVLSGRSSRLIGLFILFYLAVHLAVAGLFHSTPPLDARKMYAVYAPFTAMLAPLMCVGISWVFRRGYRVEKAAAVVLAAALLASHVASDAALVLRGYTSGLGFAARSWRASETLSVIRRLPEDAEIFSNAPAAIYLHTGREAHFLPLDQQINKPTSRHFISYDAAKARKLSREEWFARNMERLEKRLEMGAVILIADQITHRDYLVSEEALIRQLNLRVLKEMSDGRMLGLAGRSYR